MTLLKIFYLQLLYFLCHSSIEFKQDVADRYWYTALNGSLSPPLPIDWEFIPTKSINQIIETNRNKVDSPLWVLDGYSNTIYSTKSTKTWKESLQTIQININQTKNIINDNSYIMIFNSVNMNNSFYALISSTNILHLWYCNTPQKCNFMMEFEVSWLYASSFVYVTDFNAYLATNDGLLNITLYNINNNNPMNTKISFDFVFDDILFDQTDNNMNILSLAYNKQLNILGIGLKEKVYRFNLSSIYHSKGNINNKSYAYTWTFGLVDSYPIDMIFFYNDLYVVNNASINVLRYFNLNNINNMEMWIRIGKHQKLPSTQIISTCLGWDNSIWFAHNNINGVITRFIPNDINLNNNNSNTSIEGEWRYYTGNRYLTGNMTTVMYGISNLNMIFIATESGLSVIYGNQTDLETKANMIEEINYPRHDLNGLVGDTPLSLYGNLSSWYGWWNDNNGLWTCMYLSGLIFKYSVTNGTDYDRVWHHTNALSMLHNVTGIGNGGLVARSYLPISYGNLGNRWINSTTMPGWQWRDDTSSDEICGHIYVYPILYDLVANTQQQKTFALNLFINIIDYILENDYKLIDHTGLPTTWGFWDPYSLNQMRDNFDERGLNSLQIMSWLMACYYYTNYQMTLYPNTVSIYKDQSQNYLNQWLYLGNQHGYFNNIINTKITIPDDINHSDDELAALGYLSFFWTQYQYNKNQNLFNKEFKDNWTQYIESKYGYFEISWNRQYKYVNSKYMSWYSTIQYLYQLNTKNNIINTDILKNNIIKDLEQWPMEWINFPIDNEDRQDIILDSTVGRSCGDASNPTCARYAFPHSEINHQRWNSNPRTLNTGNGYAEVDTGAFTMTYWMARYFNIIT